MLVSEPKLFLGSETSFASIQSHCFLVRFCVACSITFSVSAAKPITSFGRCLCVAMVCRMSGFCVRVMVSVFSCFLSFCKAAVSGL